MVETKQAYTKINKKKNPYFQQNKQEKLNLRAVNINDQPIERENNLV